MLGSGRQQGLTAIKPGVEIDPSRSHSNSRRRPTGRVYTFGHTLTLPPAPERGGALFAPVTLTDRSVDRTVAFTAETTTCKTFG